MIFKDLLKGFGVSYILVLWFFRYLAAFELVRLLSYGILLFNINLEDIYIKQTSIFRAVDIKMLDTVSGN